MDEQLLPIVDGCLWDDTAAMQATGRLTRRRVDKKVSKEEYLQDIEGAYHAIGGFARLAHLANEDPKWFFNRFGDRLLPNEKKEVEHNINIIPPLPPSPLDEVIDVTPGRADRPRITLDQGSDQASGGTSSGVGSTGGGEDSSSEDGESCSFT